MPSWPSNFMKTNNGNFQSHSHIEDEIEYVNCELCNDVIAVDELKVLIPIITEHFSESLVCQKCFKLKSNE